MAMDLLQSFLQFEPMRRITVDEALSHPYFQAIRIPQAEASCEFPLPIEFEDTLDAGMTTANLRRVMVQEIMKYHLPAHISPMCNR